MNEDRYFDVCVEYAKSSAEDILIRIQATNRGPDAARLHLLPTLWFRNTWSGGPDVHHPSLRAVTNIIIEINHEYHGRRWLSREGTPELLFTRTLSALRTGRIEYRLIRWQFQLARPGMVSDELLAHRVTSEVSLLPW